MNEPLSPELRAALASAEFLRDLSPAARDALVASAARRQVARKSFVFAAGDDAASFYVLLTGRLKLVRGGADGQEIIVRFVGPGEILGAVAALPEARYPATAEVLDEAELATWSRAALAPIVAAHPEIPARLLAVVTRRMGEVQGQLQELATERVARRVARALLRLAAQLGEKSPEGVRIDLPLSRQDLAELTGTTLFTVSRLLSAWESEGLLDLGRERVTIRSPHALVHIAEDLV